MSAKVLKRFIFVNKIVATVLVSLSVGLGAPQLLGTGATVAFADGTTTGTSATTDTSSGATPSSSGSTSGTGTTTDTSGSTSGTGTATDTSGTTSGSATTTTSGGTASGSSASSTQTTTLQTQTWLENPTSGSSLSGTASVYGWLLDPVGVKSLDVCIDGVSVGQAVYGDARPDVEQVYPDYNNPNSGYHFYLDTTSLTNGNHTLSLLLTRTDGSQSTLSPTPISIANAQAAVGTVSGVVTDDAGAALQGASVSLVNSSGVTVTSTTSAADGSYEFQSVPLGTYSVSAQKSGFATQTSSAVTVTANQTSSVSLSLKAILPTESWLDQPTSGTTLTGTAPVSGWLLDGVGVDSISVLVDGNVVGQATYGDSRPDVEATYSAYQNANCGFHYYLDTTNLTNGSHTLSLRLTRTDGTEADLDSVTITVSNQAQVGTVTGVVTGDGTHGLQGATVTLLDESGNPVSTQSTDTLGSFTFSNVDSGSYSLQVSDNGYMQSQTSINVQTGQTTSQNIELAPTLPTREWLENPTSGSTLSGVAALYGWALDGIGIESVNIILDGTKVGSATYGESRPDVQAVYPEYNTANSGYHYYLDTTELSNGTHTLAVEVVRTDGTVVTFSPVQVTISNVPAYVNGTITADGTHGIAGASVTAEDAPGQTVATATTDASGNYSLNLKAGTYTVVVSDPGYSETQTSVTLAEGQSDTQNFTIEPQLPTVDWIENPTSGGTLTGVTPVYGWLLDGVGVQSISFLVDGSVVGQASYGDARPDVAGVYPAYGNANGGFHGYIDTTKLTNGSHTLSLLFTRTDGSEYILSPTSVTVSNVPGDIHGVVTGESNVLVKGATITVTDPTGNQLYSTTTDSTGTFDLPNTRAGSYTVMIQQAGYNSFSQSIDVGQGQKVEVDATLVPSLPTKEWLDNPVSLSTLTGTTNVSGWLLDGIGVQSIAVQVDGTTVGLATYGDTRSDVQAAFPDYNNANGGFHYALDTTQFTNGTHSLTIVLTRVDGTQVTYPAVSITVSNFGTLAGVVTGDGNVGIAGAQVTVVNSSGKNVATLTTQSDGTFAIQKLAPDTYTIVVHKPGYNGASSANKTVKGGQVTTGNLSLTPAIPTEFVLEPSVLHAPVNTSETLTGLVTDGIGVQTINILVDGKVAGVQTVNMPSLMPGVVPVAAPIHLKLDATQVTDGSHELSVQVIRTDGTIVTSQSVAITVKNPKKVGAIYGTVTGKRSAKQDSVQVNVWDAHGNAIQTKTVPVNSSFVLPDVPIGKTTVTIQYGNTVAKTAVDVEGDVSLGNVVVG